MVFHWSLSDSKFPQVSRTLLSILAVLNNVVVWMVSTCPPTSKSSTPFNNPLVTVPKAPIIIGIIIILMFHSFFHSLAKSRYLSFLLVLFCGQPRQQSRQFCKFYFTPLGIFQTSTSRWFLSGVSVTASLLKSPGLFSGFWRILKIQ